MPDKASRSGNGVVGQARVREKLEVGDDTLGTLIRETTREQARLGCQTGHTRENSTRPKRFNLVGKMRFLIEFSF